MEATTEPCAGDLSPPRELVLSDSQIDALARLLLDLADRNGPPPKDEEDES